MKLCVILALLVLAGVGSCSGVKIRYNGRMSLHQPYVDSSGHVEAWKILGDASILARGNNPGVYLLGSRAGSSGGIVSRVPLRMSGWRADIYLENAGSRSVGVWVGREPVANAREVFGGPREFSGVVAFVAFEKTALTSGAPVAGVAVGLGGELTVKQTSRIGLSEFGVIRVQYLEGTLTMHYGSSLKELVEVASLADVYLDSACYLGVTGDTGRANSELLIKNISVFLAALSSRAKEAEEEASRTRSSFVWIVFLVLFGGIGVYLYRQKAAPKSKKILKY